jgi:hypothetical protein
MILTWYCKRESLIMLNSPSPPTAPPDDAVLGSREDDGMEPPFGAGVAAAAGVRLGPPKSEKDMMIVEYGNTWRLAMITATTTTELGEMMRGKFCVVRDSIHCDVMHDSCCIHKLEALQHHEVVSKFNYRKVIKNVDPQTSTRLILECSIWGMDKGVDGPLDC